VSLIQVAYLHSSDGHTQLADEKSAAQVGYSSVLDASISTSYKLGLPSVLVPVAGYKQCVVWYPIGDAGKGLPDEVVLDGQDHELQDLSGGQACGSENAHDERRLRRSLLSKFYAELTNEVNRTGPNEAWILLCSIVRRMFDDIAVHRGRTGFVD
jgi:hypothetical protein